MTRRKFHVQIHFGKKSTKKHIEWIYWSESFKYLSDNASIFIKIMGVTNPYTCAFLWPMVNERTTLIRAPTNACLSLVFCLWPHVSSHVNTKHKRDTHMTDAYTVCVTYQHIDTMASILSIPSLLHYPFRSPHLLLCQCYSSSIFKNTKPCKLLGKSRKNVLVLFLCWPMRIAAIKCSIV